MAICSKSAKTNQQRSGEKVSRPLAVSLLVRLRRTTRSLYPAESIAYLRGTLLNRFSVFYSAARLREMTPELMMELPAELRLELKNAVDVIDFEGTRDVIEKTHGQNVAIANSLTDLVKQYRFDRLRELLEQS